MNTKKILNFIGVIVAVFLIAGISINSKVIDYDKKWKQTEEFVNEGLPKSALKVVDEIYKTAKEENNSPQLIKSLIYRISLQSKFQEEGILKSIAYFENEIKTSEEPVKQILQSLTANLYEGYYSENRYKINSRNTLEDYENDDISTWDALSFEKKIKNLYLQSLDNSSFLKELKLQKYALVLTDKDSSNFKLYPSLYDILANRTLNHLTDNNNVGDIIPLREVNFDVALGNTSVFLKSSIISDTANSDEKLISGLFKDLISFHQQNNDTTALIDLELRRLSYYKKKANESLTYDDIYLKSLFNLKSKFNDNPSSVRISFEIGNVYEYYGNQYNRLEGEKNRWYLAKALEVYKEAVNKFPNSNYTAQCKSHIKSLEKQEVSITKHDVELPGKPILASLDFKNINKLYFRIIKAGEDFISEPFRSHKSEELTELLQSIPVKQFSIELPNSTDYQTHNSEIKLPALNTGAYYILASPDSVFNNTSLISKSFINISKLSYIIKSNNEEQISRMYVLDRETGKGIKNVELTIFHKSNDNGRREYELKEVEKINSGKNGLIEINSIHRNNIRFYIFRLKKGDDVLYSGEYLNYYGNRNERTTKQTWLFTDRAIYKPGQTVYFKGILTSKKTNNYKLLINEEDKIIIRNANYKVIKEIAVKSNEYGSFKGEFTIPQGMMNGQFRIQSNNGSQNFKVENYKRPGFKIVFDTIKDQFKIGDRIKIKGIVEDYAGSAVENAEVKYTIKRKQGFPGWPYYSGAIYYNHSVEIENGIGKTSKDGSFEIEFIAKTDKPIVVKNISYYFDIEADVTDITGETQSASQTLRLSDSYIFLSIEANEKMDVNNNSIIINAVNSSSYKVKANVKSRLYKLLTPDAPLLSRDWNQPDVFLMGKSEFKEYFPNNIYKDESDSDKLEKTLLIEDEYNLYGEQNILKNELSNLNPGEYYLEITAKDKTGNEQKTEKYFSMYSSVSSEVSNNEVLSMFVDKQKAEVGEEIILSISSADKSTYIYYEIVNNNISKIKKWIKLSNSQKNIKIPVREEYRGGFSVFAIAIKDNRIYSLSESINVPYQNKKLDIKLETFRDYLTPGANEEWNITINDATGKGAVAELLASMYDASLDKFAANSWDFKLRKSKQGNYNWKNSSFNTKNSTTYSPNSNIYIKQYTENYPDFDWFGFHFFNPAYVLRSTANNEASQKDAGAMDLMDIRESEANELQVVDESTNSETDKKQNNESELIPLRTNFNETAFFYPQLKTDEEGKTIISFKTPDALTEWKIMLLAHDQELKIGQLVKNIKAKKELMLLPNVPRFVRQGDELSFTSKVVNLSENDMNVVVEIEFFDALKMEKLNISEDELSKNVTIEAKSNTSLSWKINIPDNISMLTYRIKAKSEKFTDGEERSIPVLTNRMLVTETMPMFINANQNKTYVFKDIDKKLKASTSIKNYSYTIEITSNPVWYAIQALPYIAENNNKSIISLFNRYYSNSISSFIVNSNPKIKTVFEHWKQLSPDSFLSKLQKNAELKSAVLEATPWVMESENEEEQMHRLGVLFDLNKLSNDKMNSLDKLENMQLSSGAWPWFNGMQEDEYSTQKIVLGFARLNDRKIISLESDRALQSMIKKALRFLDKEVYNDYENLKKNHPQTLSSDNLSSSKIQYLYLRSLLIKEFPLNDDNTSAFNYYLAQAKKYWLKKNNYMQSMIAISLNRLSYRNEAEGITRSLEERAITNEEMGMYWKQNNGWHWYEAPVETQAMIIEAFIEIQNQKDLINQMKVWLLKQKQTQSWATSSASVEAVFALLKNDGQRLINDSKDVLIKVGGKPLTLQENQIKEAGTGYFKTIWKDAEFDGDLSKIELQNPNDNIAWGAAYWQYFEDMDKVLPGNSNLSVEKKLFVERFTDNETVIIPLETGQKIKVGDKLFSRIIIRSDRDMEFVHLKDMRSSALEPINNISGYKYSGGLGYYENIKDVQTDFFIRYLRKGTYVLEYPVFVTQKGKFSNGIANIQSMYAPEFSAHSEGIAIEIQ